MSMTNTDSSQSPFRVRRPGFRALLFSALAGWLACQGSSGSPFGFGNEASGGAPAGGGRGGSGGSGGSSGLGSGLGNLPGGLPIAPDRADGGAGASDVPPIATPGTARFKFCHLLPAGEMPVPFELTVGSTTLEVVNGTCAPEVGAECPTIAAGSHTLVLSNQGNKIMMADYTFVGGKEYVFVPAYDSATRGFKFLHAAINEIKDQGTCAGLAWSDLAPYLDPAPDAGAGNPDAAAPSPDAPPAAADAAVDLAPPQSDAASPADAGSRADTSAPPSGS